MSPYNLRLFCSSSVKNGIGDRDCVASVDCLRLLLLLFSHSVMSNG